MMDKFIDKINKGLSKCTEVLEEDNGRLSMTRLVVLFVTAFVMFETHKLLNAPGTQIMDVIKFFTSIEGVALGVKVSQKIVENK